MTGAAELGGNWALENQFGTIQAAHPFQGAVAGSYSGLLALPADENFQSYIPDGLPHPSPLTLGGFDYVLSDGGESGIFDSASGNMLWLNSQGASGIHTFEIRSSSLSNNFALQSLVLETRDSTWSSHFIVRGYDGGSGTNAKVSAIIDLTSLSFTM